jgi:hypothetical protein
VNRLCELAMKFGTDKTPYWNNCTGHCYTMFYEDLLRARKIKNLLEIGICTGASLRMWEEYLPEARIFGIDIAPGTMFSTERIKTFFCDAGNPSEIGMLMEAINVPLDLVIDDGSHLVTDQIVAAEALIPFLADDGCYVIEDVQEGTIDELERGIHFPLKIVNVKSDIAPHRSDDCLIVAWRAE